MNKYILTIIISLCCHVSIFANGATTVHSSVTGTGDPVFKDMPDVKLISEKLFIKLNYEYSDIKVKYILWNNSDIDYMNLHYGFPMDYIDMSGERRTASPWGEPYLKNIKFTADNTVLDFTSAADKLLDEERQLYRKWHFTQLSIPRYSFVTLEVEYSVLNGYVEDGASPLFLYDFEGKGMFLSYDFSPASHWGDGIIRDFYLEVDAAALNLSGKRRYYPYFMNSQYNEDYELQEQITENGVVSKSFELKQQGYQYTCRVRNFDLKKAGPLFISFGYSPPINVVLSKKLNGDKYAMSVSSETKQYPASNLSDMNLETAWVAPDGGIGAWIEFTLKDKKTALAGLTLVNGYTKNEKTYTENNRVKKLLIQVKEKRHGKYSEGFEMELEDKPYELVYFEDLIDKVSWIDFFDYYDGGIFDETKWGDGTYDNYVESVKITILEVYPGTKYNDTCISEILLFE